MNHTLLVDTLFVFFRLLILIAASISETSGHKTGSLYIMQEVVKKWYKKHNLDIEDSTWYT